ncbi:MAG: hypothetical protein IPK72_13490 [Candidatus Eisenbacteria bacterium]|nr:hypothetical protein [Candidatus Eisenbacteria bacterium]
MPIRQQYIELPDSDRETRPTYLFMMKCLLYSRMETGLVSNKDFYDEDVNVYIAHLLNSFMHPDYLERSRAYLSSYDTEVFSRLATSKDARLKYMLYKTNADFLLISLGIFDNPEMNLQKGGTAERHNRPTEEAYIGRGRTYYRFAYSYSQQIHGRHTPITEVLEKLSDGFEKYSRVLAHMRGEYLDLLRRLSRGEIYHLERVVNESQRDEVIKQKQDQVLDLYLEWKRSRDETLKDQMKNILDELKEMNSALNLELPE